MQKKCISNIGRATLLSKKIFLANIDSTYHMALIDNHGRTIDYARIAVTDQCNLPEGFTHSAAIRIGTGAASVEDGMRQLLAMSDADRERMGRAGRALVEVNFTWDKVATQMKEVYAWILGGGEKPSCVQ